MSNNEAGRIDVHLPEQLTAGELVTIKFEYTAGSSGMVENGKIKIGLPNVGWTPPLVPQYYFWSEYAKGKDRTYTDYDRVNTTAHVETRTEKSSSAVPLLESEPRFRKPWTFPPSWLRDYDRYWITVTLEDDRLAPGDKIFIIYGDPEQRPLTARIQNFPEKKLCFLAFADIHGSGQFEEVPGSPFFTSVNSGPASRIDVVVPSLIRPDDKPEALVAYTDRVKAPPEPLPFVKSLKIQSGSDAKQNRCINIGRKIDSIRIAVPELTNSRAEYAPARVLVTDMSDAKREFAAESNPALLRPDGYRLFWGDLHGQSQYHGWNPEEKVGISCNTPEECYCYVRDIAGLDFCAVTDTASIIKDIWQDTIDTAIKMNEPGRFVTFQGSEVGDNVHGHRNLLFSGSSPEPGIVSSHEGMRGDMRYELETPNMQKYYAGRNDVILVPHHTKMWNNWDFYSGDENLEPVLEIYSIWGSGEKSGTDLWGLREMTGGAQEAWARGYKIGVIAGSDTHAGLPGRSIPLSDRDDFLPFPAGIAGVWASELTREGIFSALRKRRCYGTTGVLIILETFIDENPMGSEIPWPDKKRKREFNVSVFAVDDIDTITVVKNNCDVYNKTPKSDKAQFVWEDESKAKPGDYYYVRVTQSDGNRAWSSPIWLK